MPATHRSWKKIGRICEAPGVAGSVSHAALPVVEVCGNLHCHVYFSTRDAEGRSRIGMGTLNLDAATPSLSVRREPVLLPGALGAFDDAGVTTSCLVIDRERRFQYYSGWTRGVSVPFYFFAGLAISNDAGRTYHRASPSPILERNEIDPYLTASPWVIREGGVWRMWYVSGTGWKYVDANPRHSYHIKYAESVDGIRWIRNGLVSIDFQSPDEYAIARPCVLKDADGVYRMWYSYRGDRYRIGYAESPDGFTWVRQDERAGLDVSDEGWDSETVEYPLVFDTGGRRYMLYNGNGYGRTGMGLAVLSE